MSEVDVLLKENGIFTAEIPEIYLFVCTGNTCRSPMAAALFNHLYSHRGIGMSAGICADGSAISANAVLALRHRGIKSEGTNDYENHVSRQLSKEDLSNADRVICLTNRHAMAIISAFPEFAEKVCVLGEISDPYGGDLMQYEKCLSQIEKSLNEMFGETHDSDN